MYNRKIDITEINPFETEKRGHSKIEEYEITVATKEEINEKIQQIFNDLEQKYGKGHVTHRPKSNIYHKDENGKIVSWTIKGKFICFIPEKSIDDDYTR